MEIIVAALTVILITAQLILSASQIKKGSPDGRILLIINIAVFAVWTPLTIVKFITANRIITTIWYIITTLYMLFTVWYTNMLGKNMK